MEIKIDAEEIKSYVNTYTKIHNIIVDRSEIIKTILFQDHRAIYDGWEFIYDTATFDVFFELYRPRERKGIRITIDHLAMNKKDFEDHLINIKNNNGKTTNRFTME